MIGIHKGFFQTSDAGYNFGVTAYGMLEEVNIWGFELVGKPFIYTKKTYFMRNNPNI